MNVNVNRVPLMLLLLLLLLLLFIVLCNCIFIFLIYMLFPCSTVASTSIEFVKTFRQPNGQTNKQNTA